jgi:hypothetical protein
LRLWRLPIGCSSRIDLGGVFTAQAEGAKQGVEFTIVYSAHVNDVAPSLLSKGQQDLLKADGAQLGYGPPVGFVVKFTNGLVAYLSSDTAVFGDMKTVIHDFHKANLAVINLGPNPGMFQSGAYAINDLLKPASVIFTHVNEAATEDGKLRANTRTAALMKQVKAPAYLAISEGTMEFDDKGKCVSGWSKTLKGSIFWISTSRERGPMRQIFSSGSLGETCALARATAAAAAARAAAEASHVGPSIGNPANDDMHSAHRRRI